jgi:hypothetical protein
VAADLKATDDAAVFADPWANRLNSDVNAEQAALQALHQDDVDAANVAAQAGAAPSCDAQAQADAAAFAHDAAQFTSDAASAASTVSTIDADVTSLGTDASAPSAAAGSGTIPTAQQVTQTENSATQAAAQLQQALATDEGDSQVQAGEAAQQRAQMNCP